jgi:hypothetical protein
MPMPRTLAAPRARAHQLDPDAVHGFIDDLVGDDLHAKRVLSLTNGVIGVRHTTTLAIHAIGSALAQVRDLVPKHAIKQIDRSLSNAALDPVRMAHHWITYVLASRNEVVVAMDWTDFDNDG